VVAPHPLRAEVPDPAARVTASLSRVRARSDELLVSVYDLLFQRRPDLRGLFPADMAPQRAKLASALELIVQNLRCREHIMTVLEELGNRHVQYGATVEHLSLLGDALLVGLELHDPMPWDDETREAWRAAYASISQGMQHGLRSGTVTKPELTQLELDSDAEMA
jgi:hemoglobin-like flavoprotein